MNDQKVSVFGLGIMGRALVQNLEADGVLGATWNRSPRPDVTGFTADIGSAVDRSRILLLVVSDGAATSAVFDQLQPYLTAEHVVVNCATVGPDENRALDRRARDAGARFCEALMGGSKLAAINRKLPFYLGGDVDVIDRLRPILEPLSPACIHVGDVGDASIAKLAMNLNLAMQVVALCESYAFATSNGLSDDQYFNVLRHNTGWNYLCEYKEPKLRARDFEAQFSVTNMLKDVRLSLASDHTAKGLKLLPFAESIYAAGETGGLGDEDMVALLKLVQP